MTYTQVPKDWLRHPWYPENINRLRPDAITDVDQLEAGTIVAEFGTYYTVHNNLVSVNTGKIALVNTARVFRIEDSTVEDGGLVWGKYLRATALDAAGNDVSRVRGNYLTEDKISLQSFGLALDSDKPYYSGFTRGLLRVSPDEHPIPVTSLPVPQGYINGDNSYGTCFTQGNHAVILDSSLDHFIPGGDVDVATQDVVDNLGRRKDTPQFRPDVAGWVILAAYGAAGA